MVAVALLIALVAAPAALARSVLELPYPEAFGQFDAATYDEHGERLGAARFAIEQLPGGRVQMTVRTGIDGGASNIASILLAPREDGPGLRAVEQRSESRDAAGRSLGLLHIDHEAGVGSCTPAGDEGHAESIALPKQERIANVALNLLFHPMALGETERTDFQVFVCRGGPRVIAFSAAREPRRDVPAGERIVEIRYKPDLGPAIGWVVGDLLPQFSFWLDREGHYLAHRIPLYTEGPEVLVVREGISPLALTRSD